MKLKDKIFPSVVVAALFVFTILIFAPSHIFLTNTNEFNTSYFELLGYLALFALPVFVLTITLLILLPKTWDVYKKIVVLLLSLALLLWLQGNILVWNYGLLTGAKIRFNPYFYIFTLAIWLTVIFIAFKKYVFLFAHVKIIGSAFLIVQIVSIMILIFNQPEIDDLKRYEFNKTNEFTFSEKSNVIIMILDTFQSDIFQKIVDEDQSYKDIFQGFTYYRDSMSAFPTTYPSIPNILTGQYYDNSVPFHDFQQNAYLSNTSIPKVLTDNEFAVESYSALAYPDKTIFSNVRERHSTDRSTITKIYNAALFRYAPDVIKKYIYSDGKWFLSNFDPIQLASNEGNNDKVPDRVPPVVFDTKALTLDDIAFINGMISYSDTIDGKSIFKVYHLNGCHAPFLLNENLNYEEMPCSEEYEKQDAYSRQAKANLQIMKLFLEELKRLEVFDNSMIFIIGDHGVFTEMGNMQASANPLFLVKRLNGKGQMIVSATPVSLADIPNTIFSEMGLSVRLTGKSIFELTATDIRERRFLYYNWDDKWNLDHLPTTREYMISGPVWLERSWRATGNIYRADSAEKSFLEWTDGFYLLEKGGNSNWRWCSSEGMLIINNTSNKERKFVISAEFATGYPEMADLKIESPIVNEKLSINNAGYKYKKEIVVGPGNYIVKFASNARSVDTPTDARVLVFCMHDFQMLEIK